MAGYAIHPSLSYFPQGHKFRLHVETRGRPVTSSPASSACFYTELEPQGWDRGDQREECPGRARKGEHGWSCSSTRFQDRRPGHTLSLGSMPPRVPHSRREVRQSRQCLNASPSSRRFPAEDEPAARGSDSWNQEALKPILSLPIYCRR